MVISVWAPNWKPMGEIIITSNLLILPGLCRTRLSSLAEIKIPITKMNNRSILKNCT
jgi:hypothetical protein